MSRLSNLCACAMLALASLVSEGASAENNYPVVLVHGFLGFGPESHPLGSFLYWGGTGNIAAHISSYHGPHFVYTAAVGAIASNWDRAAELYALMPFKAPPDMSRFLLSPMPGLLVDVAVQPGQKVQAGERLAVIEAMKMENVLFAAADGVVGKVLAAKGESLTVDQPIVEFE